MTNDAPVTHGGVELGGAVHNRAVLDRGLGPNNNRPVVATKYRTGPNTRFWPHGDIANDDRLGVDESARVDIWGAVT